MYSVGSVASTFWDNLLLWINAILLQHHTLHLCHILELPAMDFKSERIFVNDKWKDILNFSVILPSLWLYDWMKLAHLSEIDVQLHRDIFNYPFKLLPGVSLANKVTLRNWHLFECHLCFASTINIAFSHALRLLLKDEKDQKRHHFTNGVSAWKGRIFHLTFYKAFHQNNCIRFTAEGQVWNITQQIAWGDWDLKPFQGWGKHRKGIRMRSGHCYKPALYSYVAKKKDTQGLQVFNFTIKFCQG